MNTPKVTVIVPIYNIEGYIKRAVDSIISQTFTNWEMFLVDDGSSDTSGAICDEIALNDSRVRVIHQENQGAAAARNVAIDKARGKFIYFMDGDDWASSDMLEDMVRLAENYKMDAWAGKPQAKDAREFKKTEEIPEEECAQLVITGFYIETYYSAKEYYIQKQSVEPVTFPSKYEFRVKAHELFDKNLLYTPWNKLYLTSYIKENKIYFPKVHWDDFPFNLDVIRHVERVTVSDKAYYHFQRQRSESESEKYNMGLYTKREEENQWLIDLYEGWRVEQQLDIMSSNAKIKIKDAEEEGKVSEVSELTEASEECETLEASEITEASEEGETSEASEITEASEEGETSEASEATEASVAEAVSNNFLSENAVKVPRVNMPSPEAQEFMARRYLERIIGCIENVTNPACRLSFLEKHGEIERIINRDTVRQALKVAKPRSSYLKIMLIPVRLKAVILCYWEGKLISRMKSKNVKLFARLKANR